METIVRDVADLFRAFRSTHDATGSLASLAKLLDAYEPALVFLADAAGTVIVAHATGSEPSREDVDALASEMSRRLGDAEKCTCDVPCDIPCGPEGHAEQAALAVRLGAEAEWSILGGIVGHRRIFEQQFDQLAGALSVCGALAWNTITSKQAETHSSTRIQHLLAEHDTLRASKP